MKDSRDSGQYTCESMMRESLATSYKSLDFVVPVPLVSNQGQRNREGSPQAFG